MSVIKGKISGKKVVDIRLEGELIAGISVSSPNHDDQRLPDEDLWIAPGFIDIQVNGFAGVDLNHADFRGDTFPGDIKSSTMIY